VPGALDPSAGGQERTCASSATGDGLAALLDCQRARPLIAQIRVWVQQNDPENPVVFGILDENEAVCSIAEATATAAFLTGNVTPSATPTGTPTP